MAGNFFTGHPASAQQFSTVTPQQQGLKGAANNQAMQFLQQLGGNFGQSPIAKRALQQFHSQTVPGIAERFTAMGPGAQRGSAFQSQLGQAGGELQGGLAALEQQNAMQLLPQLFQGALGPEFENAITQADNGLLGQIIPAITAILAAYFGGPQAGLATYGATSRASQPGQTTTSQQQQPNFQGFQPNQRIGQFPDFNALIGNVTQPRYF